MKKTILLAIMFLLAGALVSCVPIPCFAQAPWFGGIPILEKADCSAVIGEGDLCWDTDNDALYVGTGAASTAVGAAGAGDVTSVVAGVGLSGGGDAGDLTLTLDATETDDITWGAAAGTSHAWTFDTGNTADPILTFSDGLVTYGQNASIALFDGVKLTGYNGSLTLLGLGDGSDESVTFDFNSTANTISMSSSSGADHLVTLGSLSILSTGIELIGSNGVLTVWGQGDGQDENLLVDLNATANVANVTSGTGVDTVKFSSMNVSAGKAFTVPVVADVVAQVGAIVMIDAGTDARFDLATAGSVMPIGIVTGTGATVQGTSYEIAVGGMSYLWPQEDLVTITRGWACSVSKAGSANGSAICSDNLSTIEHNGEVGHPIYSEAAIAFDGAADVDPDTDTITLDSDPPWSVGDPVVYWNSADTTPTGMADGAVYWIKTESTTAVTLSATKGGAVLDITADGSGTTMYLMRLPLCVIHWN